MKKVIPFVILIFVVIGGILIWQANQKDKTESKPLTQEQRMESASNIGEVHLHASFLIFTNGTKRVFTDTKYHQRDTRAHLHTSTPSVIHVNLLPVTWQEFFDSLPSPMKVETNCFTTGTNQKFCTEGNTTLKFFLNGQLLDPTILASTINDGDMFLISFGAENENQLQNQLNQLPNPKLLNLNPAE